MLDEMDRIFEIKKEVIINVRIVPLLNCDPEQERKYMEDLQKIAPNLQNASTIKKEV